VLSIEALNHFFINLLLILVDMIKFNFTYLSFFHLFFFIFNLTLLKDFFKVLNNSRLS